MSSAEFADSYRWSVAETFKRLDVSLEQGLSPNEATERQRRYGTNDLPAPAQTSFWKLVLKQFDDLLVQILLGAAVISLLLGLLEEEGSLFAALIEPGVIMTILVLNAIVGVVQETNAESAIRSLKEYEASSATVLRSGDWVTLSPRELVPGDVIRLRVGEKVPADARVVRLVTQTLRTDESMLTGEADSASKHTEAVDLSDAVDQDKRNMLFSGTLVVRGQAIAVVTLTGAATSFGRIQAGLEQDEEESTPLEEKLDRFAEFLSKVILVICLLVWVINIGHFTDPEHGGVMRGAIYYFKIAVALAVAAIPEGLPAVVTTCLALGTRKMARKNAIVRSLPSVETLGCTTVICSDKTGTLTTNQMTVQRVAIVDRDGKVHEFGVDGASYSPYGCVNDLRRGDQHAVPQPAVAHASLARLAHIATACNEAIITLDNGNFAISGEPTEGALKVLAEKISVPDETEATQHLNSQDNDLRAHATERFWTVRWQKQHVLEFTRARKSMSVLVRNEATHEGMLLVKGAPESVLERCTHVMLDDGSVVSMSAATRAACDAACLRYARAGLRCLATAFRAANDSLSGANLEDHDEYAAIESGLVFVGLAAMKDPPRPEVRDSIRKCSEAGIRVVVITGDNQATAEAICRSIGVLDADEADVSGLSFTGRAFMRLSDQEQREAVKTAVLFSRVEPSHKLHLVNLLKEQGEVVAMTGDGVNDAPALSRADIGIGMGSGTAVAREASDMVLQDDNFATIVMAVEQGRAIYANTKQFIRYLISSNIGEVVCIFLTAALQTPEALIPVQLLWVNLVTDGLPATALGFNKPDKDIMRQPPRGRTEEIINGWMFCRYLAIGLYIGVGTVLGFVWWYLWYAEGPQLSWWQLTHFKSCASGGDEWSGVDCAVFSGDGWSHASTVSLSVLVTIEMFNTFNALSENNSLLVTKPWSNPWVTLAVALSMALHCAILYVPWAAAIFSTAPLSAAEWYAVLVISLPVILFDEVLKLISRNVAGRAALARKKTQ